MYRVFWKDTQLHVNYFNVLEFTDKEKAIAESIEKVKQGHYACWVEEDCEVLK